MHGHLRELVVFGQWQLSVAVEPERVAGDDFFHICIQNLSVLYPCRMSLMHLPPEDICIGHSVSYLKKLPFNDFPAVQHIASTLEVFVN